MCLLLLWLLLLVGCSQPKVGIVESVITLHTAAGTAGIDAPVPAACIWIIGRAAPARAMSMVLAHGGVTVEQCLALGMP